MDNLECHFTTPGLFDDTIPNMCSENTSTRSNSIEKKDETLDESGNDLIDHTKPEMVTENDSTVFTVEKILKRRKKNGSVEFLVKWKNYSQK